MAAKYKPNHGVCNLIVDVLIDGLVRLLQYPDFCAICCFCMVFVFFKHFSQQCVRAMLIH